MILIFHTLTAQIVFNEIMIDPENDNTGEFIEIYNAGDSVIDLRDLYLCDAQDTDRVLVFPDSLLLPGMYGLILDPDYTGEYNDLIPDSIPLFTISDSRFGMYGISNSTSKPFSLLDSDHSIIDTYITGEPFWPDPLFTIERKSYLTQEWNASLTEAGTPGFKNSTAIKDHDLMLSDLKCIPEDSLIAISFLIINTGSKDIDELFFGYIVDIPLNPFLLNDTMFFKQTVSMSPGDSLFLNYEHRCRFKGAADVIAWAGYPKIDYDSLYQSVFIPIANDEIIITEFVCKTGDRFTSEYIEILNRSPSPLSLKGIEVHDLTGHTSIDSHYVIGVDSMLVLAQSTSFHDDFPYVKNYIIPPAWRSLNNNEDQIVLANPISSTLCDLNYNSDWDIANDCAMQLVDTALDYRNDKNWEVSYNGSPGKFNTTDRELRHLSFYSEKDFFVHGDTVVFSIIND